MNLKLEISLLFLGGLLKLIDIGSDIWYLITQPFSSDFLYYTAISSLIAPTLIMFLIYIVIIFSDICRSTKFSCFKFMLFQLFIFGDCISLNYFIFTCILCCSEIFSGDFYIVDSMFRLTSLINSIFHSTPQIILQVYNNVQWGRWSILNIVSIAASSLSLLYTLIKLVNAVDKMQQYEAVSYSAKIKIADSKIVTARNEVKESNVESEHRDDVYEDSS